MEIGSKVYKAFRATLRADQSSVLYVLFYTLLEGILVLAIPLTSSFVINSIMAHSYISILTLGVIILVIFFLMVLLRLLQEYIIEKFEQRVFVREGFYVGERAVQRKALLDDHAIDKLMNYFFDITTIQKIFPIFILNGAGLLIQILLTLLLLLVFDSYLFFGALALIVINIVLVILLGKNGILYAIKRSDAKHNTIHFLQKIPYQKKQEANLLDELEEHMSFYVDARQDHFFVRIKQLGVSFIIQGLMITGFFMLGASLVINGQMPVGEFVASEIIVVTLIYAMNSFVKQLDYIYDGIEGYYKVEKLSEHLSEPSER